MKFTDLDAWKEAHLLTLLIYDLARKFPKEELYGLSSQVKRAAISVESCIAEGFHQYHFKDRLNFYYDARGSIAEVETQLMIAKDLGFITKVDFEKAYNKAEKVGIILTGLIKSTQNLSKK